MGCHSIPSPGNLPHPGIEPGSPALQADSLSTELPGKPNHQEVKSANEHERGWQQSFLQNLQSRIEPSWLLDLSLVIHSLGREPSHIVLGFWSIEPWANKQVGFLKCFYLLIWLSWVLVVACGIFNLHCGICNQVSWPGIKPKSPALRIQSLSHWTTREVPGVVFLPMKFMWSQCQFQTLTNSFTFHRYTPNSYQS